MARHSRGWVSAGRFDGGIICDRLIYDRSLGLGDDCGDLCFNSFVAGGYKGACDWNRK